MSQKLNRRLRGKLRNSPSMAVVWMWVVVMAHGGCRAESHRPPPVADAAAARVGRTEIDGARAREAEPTFSRRGRVFTVTPADAAVGSLDTAGSPSSTTGRALGLPDPGGSASSTGRDDTAPLAGLAAEERERDPGSESVTIKVQVDPPKRARVFWGAKDLGLSPLEIRRPRGSGPVDLILRAPGYLTVHIRAFTDRDDKVTVRLVPETEAPRMFGYRGK